MRYSFHGKVRATGQVVDGFVEAPNSALAIDRLADQGIIGVYSVRADPKPAKDTVRLGHQPEPDPEAESLRRMEQVAKRAAELVGLPGPAAAPTPASESAMNQLVDKLSTLLVQVEKVLSRPQQVIYQQAGPARNAGAGGSKKPSRMASDQQTSTLRDIFQNNLDLRQSLEKLATTVNPPAANPAPAKANGTPATAPASPQLVAAETSPSIREASREASRETPSAKLEMVDAQPQSHHQPQPV